MLKPVLLVAMCTVSILLAFKLVLLLSDVDMLHYYLRISKMLFIDYWKRVVYKRFLLRELLVSCMNTMHNKRLQFC